MIFSDHGVVFLFCSVWDTAALQSLKLELQFLDAVCRLYMRHRTCSAALLSYKQADAKPSRPG